MDILMENYKQQMHLKPKHDWVKILHQDVEEYKYGYRGEIFYCTERNPNIQKISSVHLQLNNGFNYLFEFIH